MKRKIVKHGSNTLTVSLPAKWCKQFNIKNGDEIEIEEQNTYLLLKLERKNEELKKIIINIDNLTQSLIWRSFIAAYRSGYDEIIMKFSDIERKYEVELSGLKILEKKIKMDTIEIIQDVTSRCIGMEIIEQENNLCVIKGLGETSEKEFGSALRRIFLLILSMAEDSFLEIKKPSKSLKYIIWSADKSVDKFTDFCLRILNKKGYKDFRKTNCIYSIIILLEFIGDEYKRIVSHINESKKDISPELKKIFGDINQILNFFYLIFYRFEDKKAVEINELEREISEKIKRSYKIFSNEEIEILHHLKKIKRGIIDLLQLTIELNLTN